MKFTTLQQIANKLGHSIARNDDPDDESYSINIGELEIWATNKPVTIKTIGGERATNRNYYALIGFKHHPATRWEPEDVSDFVIGEYDGLNEAFRQACIVLATNRINNVFEGEGMEEVYMEDFAEQY